MPKILQFWPGNNRFCCDVCISGPSKQWPGMAYIQIYSLMIIVPLCILVFPSNWQITPALPLTLVFCYICMQIFLFLTACSNPGFIPRKPFLVRQPQKFKYLLEQNKNKKINIFCQTCQIYRPPKASHCSTCQNCVQVFDHHCGVIGNCIGKRNYRFFIFFLLSSFLTFVIALTNFIVFMIKKSSDSISEKTIIIIVSVIAAVVGLPLLGFFLFHLFVALTRRTTRQIIKNVNIQSIQHENQWCDVDEPIINIYEQISQAQGQSIRQQIKKLRSQLQIRNESTKYFQQKK